MKPGKRVAYYLSSFPYYCPCSCSSFLFISRTYDLPRSAADPRRSGDFSRRSASCTTATMWGASILSLAALAALPCANAITLHKRDDPAVFALPVTRSERSQALQKRSSKVASTDLYNEVCETIPDPVLVVLGSGGDGAIEPEGYTKSPIAKLVLHGEHHHRHPSPKSLPQSRHRQQ
jgi:hypothetical protein